MSALHFEKQVSLLDAQRGGRTRAWTGSGSGTRTVGFSEPVNEGGACSGLHQGADHSAGVQAAQVVVGLTRAHEHDRLARDVGHGDGCTHLWGGHMTHEEPSAFQLQRIYEQITGCSLVGDVYGPYRRWCRTW